MKEFLSLGVHSLLLTSGTLSPLAALRLELEVDFPVVLENEHVIDADQLYLGLIAKGPSGLNLNSAFKNRTRPECIAELGELIAQFSQIIPDGSIASRLVHPRRYAHGPSDCWCSSLRIRR